MKISKLLKGILLIVFSIVFLATSGVYAATTPLDDVIDGEEEQDLSSNKSNANETNTNTNKTNSNTNKTNSNTNKTNTNTNASVYNKTNNTTNTNLPKTGVEDSLPTMVLVVVFGISSVYAYKKVKDYNNI